MKQPKPKGKPGKPTPVSVLIPDPLRAALEAEAAREVRSLSGQIVKILTDWYEFDKEESES